MLSIKEQLVLLYCLVDDLLQKQPNQGKWRKSNNQPKFTDAEVITIAMMQQYFRTDTLKQTYLLVAANDRRAFPHLPSYKQWIARLQQLQSQIGGLLCYVPVNYEELDGIFVIDSLPVKLAEPIRHGRAVLLREDGAYFGKSSKGWFFGYKLHVLITSKGQILGAVLTAGNADDRDGARLLSQLLEEGGLSIADLGYRGAEFQDEMFEEGILFVTRADIAEKQLKAIHSTVRERVETVFSQLWRRFATRIFSRSWRGLWNALQLKMLDYKLSHAGLIPTA